jgi:ADP-ribose pyrophosphatase YjhB (NUDIX family)
VAESTTKSQVRADLPAHAALATVFQVRDDVLQVLLWARAREPFSGAWSLPGGALGPDETLEESILRHLAAKVDVREVAHLEQLGTWSEPERHPRYWELATAYLGLVPFGIDPRVPADTRWHPVDALPKTAFDHGAITLAGRERLRGKLSYSNVGFALAPETFTLAQLRDIYAAALGYDVSATNLKRVLVRRGAIEPTGARRAHGPSGGRPAEVFRFRTSRLEVTDPFAVLRPPTS